jgi:hypothetical protein
MKNSLRLIAIPMAAWLSLGMGAAQAELFNGLTVINYYPYYFPNLTIPYSTASMSNYLIGSHKKKVSNAVDSYDTIDLSGNSSVISFIQESSVPSKPFNGFIISDNNILSAINPYPSFKFNPVTNIDVLGHPLYVNWQGFNPDEKNLVFTAVNSETTTNPIPEPETHAM